MNRRIWAVEDDLVRMRQERREHWRRRRLRHARMALVLFCLLFAAHGWLMVAALMEGRPGSGLLGAAAAAVFYLLAVSAARDSFRA